MNEILSLNDLLHLNDEELKHTKIRLKCSRGIRKKFLTGCLIGVKMVFLVLVIMQSVS